MTLTLTAREQAALASCSDVMVRPFDYPSLDAWRGAVLDSLSQVIGNEVAFFNVRQPPDGSRTAFSREVAGALLDRYEQLCLNDGGYERAVERQLTAVSQSMIIGGAWDAYYADPAVAGFYVPNNLLDSICLLVDDPTTGVASSLELHVTRFGTRAFGVRGVAIMRLLLPCFRAGVAAVHHGNAANGGLVELLNASGGAIRAIDRWGRCVHETPRVATLLQDDPMRAEVLAGMAQLARHVAAVSGSGKRREAALTAPCALRVVTPSASYHLEATRVSAFSDRGVVMLVSVQRLSPVPLPDAELSAQYRLSPREIAVARQISTGASTREIATGLGMSVHTARRHSEQVFLKLGVHTRAAVAAALFRR
jgi:DNA-binding CsgD family transcriptional regulator